jgi:hypothetical protein
MIEMLWTESAAARIPITHDSSFDNIYSRYSSTGDRIAYYRRRFVNESPKELAVVCASDGTNAKEVFAFTDTSEARGRLYRNWNSFSSGYKGCSRAFHCLYQWQCRTLLPGPGKHKREAIAEQR